MSARLRRLVGSVFGSVFGSVIGKVIGGSAGRVVASVVVVVVGFGLLLASVFVGAPQPQLQADSPLSAPPDLPAATPTTNNPRRAEVPRVLFGEVLAANDAPITGVRVEVLSSTDQSTIVDVRTGADGQFTLDALPPTLRGLRFSAAGFLPVTVDGALLPPEGEAFWSQHLARGTAGMRIVVFATEDGHAVAGADVVVLRRRGPPPDPRFQLTRLGRTDADGVAVVESQVADNGAIVVVDASRGAHELDLGERAQLEIRVGLPLPALVQGRIVDDRDRPVRAATYRVVRPPALDAAGAALAMLVRSEGTQRLAANDDGLFDLQVAAGSILVQASAKGLRPGDSGEVEVAAGLVTHVVVTLERSPSVGGRVIDSDTGAGIAACTVTPDGGNEGAGTAQTDDDGAFVLDSLIDGPSSVSVVCAGYRRLTLGGLDGARSRQRELFIKMAKGAGEVVVGIGVVLTPVANGIGVRMGTVQAHTPAAGAGLLAGEIIEAVDDVELSSTGAGLTTAMALIRGQPESRVRLRVRAANHSTRVVDLERGLVEVKKGKGR